MASRPRRGKQMSVLRKVHHYPEESGESDSSEPEAETAEDGSGYEESTVGGVETVDGDDGTGELDDDDDDEDDEEEEDDNDDEDNELDFGPPPTPGVHLKKRNSSPNRNEPYEFKKMYQELIQTCQSLETDSKFDETFKRTMQENIRKGRKLFNKMKGVLGQPDRDYNSEGRSSRPAGNSRDMYYAFLHTKVTSSLIRNKAELIGSGPTIFSLGEFLDSLGNEFVDEDGEYSATLAAANIAMQSSHGCRRLDPLVAVVGTFDRNAELCPPPKKKPRAMPQKQVQEEQQDATDDLDNAIVPVQSNPAENVAKELYKVLKVVHRQHPSEPTNLFAFALDKSSFQKTVANIFSLSFLVKDGYISLTKEENTTAKDLSLNIKPEKNHRPEYAAVDDDENATRNQITRQKCIVPYSPRMWKHQCKSSTGEDIIASFMRMMNQQSYPVLDD